MVKLIPECVFSILSTPCCPFPCGSSWALLRASQTPSSKGCRRAISTWLSHMIALYTCRMYTDPPKKESGSRQRPQHHARNTEISTQLQREENQGFMASLISTGLTQQNSKPHPFMPQPFPSRQRRTVV